MFSSKTIPQNVNDASDLASWGNERKMLHTSLSTEAIEAETIPPRHLERLFSSSSAQQEWQEKNQLFKMKDCELLDIDINSVSPSQAGIICIVKHFAF